MKRIVYTRSALRVLRRMPVNTAKLIVSKVEQYAADPPSLANNVKALKGRTGIRLGIGDWRVIMDDDGTVLAVLEIGPRGGIYEQEKAMDTVTIDRAEYDRLVEAAAELEDLHAYDRAVARLRAGEDELIPGAYISRILAGEHPLRVYRELRGFTQQQLAAESGVNRVQIAEIEAGRKNGSVGTLKRLAAALKVTIDDLA